MNGGPHLDVAGLGNGAAAGGDDDGVERGVEAGELEAAEDVGVAFEVAEKGAVRAHLADADAGMKPGGAGALVRGGEGDEVVDALCAAEALDVVAGDEAAHAEGDEVETLVGQLAVGEGGELLGEFLDGDHAGAAIEGGGEDRAAAGAQVFGEAAHAAGVGVDAVDQDDGAQGRVGCGGGGVELRKGSGEPGDELHGGSLAGEGGGRQRQGVETLKG